MSFLVIYHQDNLLNPTKLLTHREDILAALEEAGIGYDSVDLSSGLHAGDDARLLQQLQGRFSDYPYTEILRLPPVPAYAAPAGEGGEPEQSCAGVGLRLILQGKGILCLHQGQNLYALGCRPGDLVSIPAGVGHWFRQSAGPECVVVRLAESAADLRCEPCIDGLAGNIELPEL